MTISKLPGAQFPPGSVSPHVRLSPSGPVNPIVPGIVQVGYDQPIDGLDIPPVLLGFFPRDLAGNPLKVVLPEVTPGNVLEVDWSTTMTMQVDEYYPETDAIFSAVAVVTFDGTDPSTSGGAFFIVVNSWSSQALSDSGGDDAALITATRGMAAVLIPPGATTATVELMYLSTVDCFVDGTTNKKEGLTSTVLKVTEIERALVTQLGPGLLLAFS